MDPEQPMALRASAYRVAGATMRAGSVDHGTFLICPLTLPIDLEEELS